MILQYFSQPVYISDFDSSLIELNYKLDKKWESNTITSFSNFNDLSKNSADYLINEISKFTTNIIKKQHKIKLLDFWINEYYDKDFQEPHTHVPAHFSFTIMHKIPEGSGNLKFYNPYESVGFNHCDIFFNDFEINVKPPQGENKILIWPAYIKHMVTPGTNKSKRATYSGNFNIVI